jgi:succinyl-diaminopimelate desuccinylase
MLVDPIALTQDLIRFDTVNPPGQEEHCAEHLAGLLEHHGFAVRHHAFAPGRTSLVARWHGADPGVPPLAFTGHLDTVPLGARPWSVDPFAADLRGNRLYGRGASDMKAGVAAAVTAAITAAGAGGLRRGITLLLTAGEETGCRGALHLAEAGALGEAAALIVAEPTSNRLVVTHKGALHLRARTAGRTAHGSMPELGENAVAKAARAILAAEAYRFRQSHPLLGRPSLTVTSISGGENVNSVPDACSFTIDIRTLPGMRHADLLDDLRDQLGPDVAFDAPLADLPAVGTDPADPFVRSVAQIVARHMGSEAAAPRGMPYFTDGSALQPAYGSCPTVILGPGEPGQAHQTDEWCEANRITQAAAMYVDIIRASCGH